MKDRWDLALAMATEVFFLSRSSLSEMVVFVVLSVSIGVSIRGWLGVSSNSWCSSGSSSDWRRKEVNRGFTVSIMLQL